MDKLIAMKIKYDDGTYSDEIPICAFAENVEWDESHTLVDVLGNVNLNSSIQDQITYLFNNKMDATALENYVASELGADVTAWLNAHVNPVGSAVVVDDSLSISGAAADAKATGDSINDIKADLSYSGIGNAFDGQLSNAYWNASGVLVSYNGDVCNTNKIPCSEGDKIKLFTDPIISDVSLYASFFNSAGTTRLRRDTGTGTDYEGVAPTGASYFCFTYEKTGLTKASFNSVFVYINHSIDELKSDVIELESQYSNLKNDFDSAIEFPNNLIDVTDSSVGYELSNYATANANQSYSISEYIPIVEGQEYTFGLGTNDLGRISFYQTADTSKPICLSSSDWYSGKIPSDIESAVNWFTVNDNNTMSFTVPIGYTDRQGRSINYMRFTYRTVQADKAFCIKGTHLVYDISFLGKVPYLDEEIASIYEQIPPHESIIDCLGDSHTAGVGSYTPYPSVLSGLIGNTYTVQKFGGGGDGASDITAKQGALYAICDPCTILDSQNYTNDIPLKMYSGDALRQFGLKWVGINKDALTGNLNCLLGDVPVYVSYDSTNHFKIRPVSTGGGDIEITRPTKITTTYMQTDYKSHILILCMGSNDASTVPVEKLANWNRLIAEQYQRYIIVGEPTVLTSANRAEYNDLMYAYFGVHYIDINSYMIQYGLSDAGITPTAEDEQAISKGITPPSLMYDSVHYNQYGINVMANQIYLKGKELGYWT